MRSISKGRGEDEREGRGGGIISDIKCAMQKEK
jgi:hypothetical protein